MTMEAVGRPMEILLVEDSLMAARMTMGTLAKSGIHHRLSWTSDGREAELFLSRAGQYARAPQPDLVLLDLNLPGVDGRTLLKMIRGSAILRGVPVIIMTGTEGEQAATEFESLDVQGFLLKPIDQDAFLQLVEQLKGCWKADMIVVKQA